MDHVETVQRGGQSAQRLTISFEHRGRATLDTSVAEVVPADQFSPADGGERGSGWLGSLEQAPTAEKLASLPDAATDPLRPLSQRLEATLDLYRFTNRPRDVIEWAVAWTGLSDPMSRYSRDDLDQAYQAFARQRDAQLRQLVAALRQAGKEDVLRSAVERASAAGKKALREKMEEIG